MPEKISRPEDITKPVLVKFYGAKGGRGFFIAKNYEEFMEVNPTEKHTIQEYVIGTRYYIHFFYSPLVNKGYRLSKGSLELMSMDRRDEANIDEMYKLGSQESLKHMGILPSFVVTGNIPVVLRESLLPNAFWMGERTVEKSIELFGGMVGPFSLECIVNDRLEFKVFEISARIVAGTNFFIRSSPYSDLREPEMSVGRRIAREIKLARRLKALDAVLS
jgi:5-formaminoimidazole-4-carboxamide-1-(beta)-D-ribofuranosyl 5'-monophosphate synthetase